MLARWVQRSRGGLTLPIVGVAAASAKLALDFDKSLSQINALVGASDKMMKQYADSVLRLSQDVAIAPVELADALYFITSSGFEGAEALDVLDQSARASAAGMGDTKTAADATTSVLNAYGKQAISAGEATDIILNTIKLGKAEPEELAGSIGRVIAPAQAMGVEFAEVGGALAVMSLRGIDAAETQRAQASLSPTRL